MSRFLFGSVVRLGVFVMLTAMIAATAASMHDRALRFSAEGDAENGPIAAGGPVEAGTPDVPPAARVAPGHQLSPRPVAGKARKVRPRVAHPKQRAARPRSTTRSSSSARSGSGSAPKVGGRDISWPQCPPSVGIPDLKGLNQPMPHPGVRFVIVGLTNGRAFTENPCLDMHLRWVRQHHVYAAAYAFATYPNHAQLRRYRSQGPYEDHHFLGKLRNASYAMATFNLRTMRKHRFSSPHIWLDVEPSSSRPWSGNTFWNQQVLKAWVRAYEDAGYTVGFYSTRNLWRAIVGDLELKLPEWRTVGPSSDRRALEMCSERSFQGGRAVLAQWWTSRVDYDRMCPGFGDSKTMERFFHKY